MMRAALTIAGSDSSGGAGIQADLKTFAAHGLYGLSAITAVTAQNTLGVASVTPLDADVVTAQIEAVVADLGAHAAKTGMLATAAIVEAVAAAVAALEIPLLVVDPVLVSTSGTRLLDDEGLEAMKAELLPRAHAVTPNIAEAEVLSGVAITSDADRHEAARRIRALGPAHVVITGGLGVAERIIDLLYDGEVFTELETTRVAGIHTHGTGCTFSAALTAHLALGRTLLEAIPLAQHYVAGAIRHAPGLGRGRGPMQHFWREHVDRGGRL
jgi:hydroxymethylpyrimidine/phosphomethylpyrimidine kinase